jgi:hypothetical protein
LAGAVQPLKALAFLGARGRHGGCTLYAAASRKMFNIKAIAFANVTKGTLSMQQCGVELV